MSNFLQRVAAAVIQPQTRLRPILGSVFAPPALRSPKDALPTGIETASQTSSLHRQEPIATPNFDASIPAGRDHLLPTAASEEFLPVRSHQNLSNDPLLLPVFNSPNELQKPTQAHSFPEDLNPASEPSQPAAANHSGPPASSQSQPRWRCGHQGPKPHDARSQRNVSPMRFTSILDASKWLLPLSKLRVPRQPPLEDRLT